jgi:hypothetical protein
MATIRFSQTITGNERKVIASVIAEALGTTASYAGPPTFGFNAGGWTVSKNSQVVSPEMDMSSIPTAKVVIRALSTSGLNAEGVLRVTLHGILANELQLLESVIKSKETLLKKALQTDAHLTVLWEKEEAVLSFFMATLDADKVCTYLTLAMKLAEFVKTIKYTSATDKSVENEKFTMRVLMIRLGFIGAEYKTERKVLLAPLTGNSAYSKGKPVTGEVQEQ